MQTYSFPRRPLGHSGLYNQVGSSLTQSLETKLAKAFSSDKSLVHKGVRWRDVGHLGRERNGRQALYVLHLGLTKERIINVSAAGAQKMKYHVKGAVRRSYGWHLIWCFFLLRSTNINTQPAVLHARYCVSRGGVPHFVRDKLKCKHWR